MILPIITANIAALKDSHNSESLQKCKINGWNKPFNKTRHDTTPECIVKEKSDVIKLSVSRLITNCYIF